MNNNESFLNESIDDIKKGFKEEEEFFTCLICGMKFEKGIIYQEDGQFFEAQKYMKLHVEKEHSSIFDYLINLDKKITGLSEHQCRLLKLFYEGKSDKEIQNELKIGSSSTIRNHRFVLREKERQAKIYLVLMELLKIKDKKASSYVQPHSTAKMVDDRYNLTDDENEKTLMKYFPQGLDGPLSTFHMKEKAKLVVLRQLIKRFDENRIYTEKEVNAILKAAYEDFATIRRYMIEYGFMDRKPNCSSYWVKKQDVKEENSVERKKELKLQYQEMKTEAGIYQVRNIKNQKILIISTPNLKTINGKKIELERGGFRNAKLLDDWKVYGNDSFVFEILEVLEEKEEPGFNKTDELKKLKEKWLNKLQPYGDNGYN